MSLTSAIKRQATALGFDAVGVCSAEPFERERGYLEGRASLGIDPNPFEWPDTAARVEPQRVLPGARSIVAVAMSYASSMAPVDDDRLRGWLSAYCRGSDYHTLMEERLDRLAAWLRESVPGSRSVVHVDVGAPLDRAVAERAGLGRFGKSTNLIIRGLGTWTFLGELITTVELDADAPAAWNACGRCTRCIDACPTGCLTPWSIDSTRCLGYVNQETGDMPVEFRELMGDRLFGCDDCQDVCPYNRAPAVDRHPEFAPLEATGGAPELLGLLEMEETEFEQVFAPTAAAWRGLQVLQRNAVVAAGNAGGESARAVIESAADHPDPLLRRHAAWAREQLDAHDLDPGAP